jgi:hypothetical protein
LFRRRRLGITFNQLVCADSGCCLEHPDSVDRAPCARNRDIIEDKRVKGSSPLHYARLGLAIDSDNRTPLIANKRKHQEDNNVRKRPKRQTTLVRQTANSGPVKTLQLSCNSILALVPVLFEERLLEALISLQAMRRYIALI